jgi:phage terminase Nu1 subunit (DNA packaging protein)
MEKNTFDLMKTKDITAVTVSSSVLEDIIGVSDRRIRQLADEGILVRAAKGRYNLQSSVKNYILTLKIAADSGEDPDSELNLEEVKAQHEKVKMHITQLKLALMQGEVHKSTDVEHVMKDMLSSFRARLLNVPAKLAPLLTMRDNPDWIREAITKEIIEVLGELKDYNPKDFYSEEYIESNENDDYE